MGTENNNYPRFISSKPCGIDKFGGKSQERLTDAIVKHIISTDENYKALTDEDKKKSLPRIIGLEGSWGVGKSNVIKQIKEKLEKTYYLFEYDAWGHQEDLQRRSFLELLTSKLIDKKILTGNTQVQVKGGESKTVTWEDKLQYLLARKTKTETEKYPQISKSMVVSFSVAILTPIAIFCGIILKLNNFWLSLLIAVIPIMIALIIWGIAAVRNKKYRNCDYLLALYNDKVENDICYEIISVDEPTVTEFKKWMLDISKHIGEQKKKVKKKLIIVFDNMDRLPAEKVKALWSSIHTFFSEDGFENIWAIVPFDEQHLSCAFGESSDEEKKQLTKYFISKTFPIVYRVPFPVITDFKQLFNELFEEAFGNTEINRQEKINRIYRLENPNATVREIIEFINQMVALKNIWHDEINILYIAIFVLKRDELLKLDPKRNVAEKILSGGYLGKYIPSIVQDDEVLQKNISALVYGVPLKNAEQIPMSKYLDICFSFEYNDINKYANSTAFMPILSDKINNADDPVQIYRIIQSLSQLDNTKFSEVDKKAIDLLWNTIAQKQIKVRLVKQEIDECYKLLLLRIDDENRQTVVKYICGQIQLFEEFKGENYYSALKNLGDFFESNNIDIKVTDNLIDLEKTPEIFIDYVLSAKENYPLYKLTVKPDELDNYLSDLVYSPSSNTYSPNGYSVLEILEYVHTDDNYHFTKLLSRIKETIQNSQFNEKSFKPLFDAYKILSDKKPLETQLNQTQRTNIWNALRSKTDLPEYLEIVTIQLGHINQIQQRLSNNSIQNPLTQISQINLNAEQIKIVSENIDYYASYGVLLIENISKNIPALNSVLKYMTENKLGHKLSLNNVLPRFFDIKSKLGITESYLLGQLNRWEKRKETITKDNIQTLILNADFFKYSTKTENKFKLTDYLNKTIVEKLSEVSTDTLYQQRTNLNSYWWVVIKSLIDTDFLKPLPDNLSELGKKLVDDIAKNAPNSSNELFKKIINNLDEGKASETIVHIINQICNSVLNYAMNKNKFLFLHTLFEKQNVFVSRAEEVTQYILTPIADDDECINKIINKSELYTRIISSAGNKADNFKRKIEGKIQSSSDTKLISFAKKIGIKKEEKS